MVGTIQSSVFTTLYISGTVLVLNVNLREWYKTHHKQKKEELDLLSRTKINVDGTIEQIGFLTSKTDLETKEAQSADAKALSKPMGDTLYYQFLRALGLSDKSMLLIEKDLREKHAK